MVGYEAQELIRRFEEYVNERNYWLSEEDEDINAKEEAQHLLKRLKKIAKEIGVAPPISKSDTDGLKIGEDQEWI
jgi:hypothetical protein